MAAPNQRGIKDAEGIFRITDEITVCDPVPAGLPSVGLAMVNNHGHAGSGSEELEPFPKLTSMRKRLRMYVCILTILACILFFIGFFPQKPHISSISSKTDLPTSINGTRLNVEELYRRRYSKVIFMVIDALRYDFVADGGRMPFLNRQLGNYSKSCLLSAKTGVPTVTLPRIKAMTSGSAPEFLDVIFNFGSSKMLDDNIILQANRSGYSIVFYGDDTWLRLYPDEFKRSEGTPSFFVNDFYEVDANVTRNVEEELNNSDWDIMILHYLGLDHIGHVEGPFGKSISPKLIEMDTVIERIVQHFDGKDNDVLFVITGDHGMKDSGGHGGSSQEEVTVPVVLLNSKCDKSSGDHDFRQVDLAPLLSTLLGIPAPAGSTGKVSPKWFANLNLNESLYAAYYNTLRMKRHLLTSVDEEIEDEVSRGIEYLTSFFTSSSNTFNASLASLAFLHLYNAQNKIVSRFDTANSIDLANAKYMLVAIIVLAQAMLLLFVSEAKSIIPLLFCLVIHKPLRTMAFCSCALVLLLLLTLVLDLIDPTEVDTEPRPPDYFIGGLLLYNTLVLYASGSTFAKLLRLDKLFLVVCGLLPLSYMSTSFIEEEHLFWYYTFGTLLFRAVFTGAVSPKRLLSIVALHRILMNLNPDVGDWLKESKNLSLWWSFLVVGLCLSTSANWKIGSRSKLDLIFALLQALITLLFKMTINGVYFPQSSGVLEVKFFWGVTLARLVAAWLLARSSTPRSYKILTMITQLHMSVIMLLMDAHNVILVPALILFSKWLLSSVKTPWQLVLFHYWLGEVFFYYMGNSNSISTVNVTVGFIGLKEFSLELAVMFVALHTYAYQILSYLMLSIELIKRKRYNPDEGRKFHNLMCSIYLLMNGLPLLLFMLVILLQREHLFIWSVFSPKLLYLMVHSILIVALNVSTIVL